MPKYEATAGEKYGRLTLVKETVCTPKKHKWLCRCDCGNYTEVSIYLLKSGECKSCGCLRNEVATERCYSMARHNMSRTRIYRVWSGMIGRCKNSNNKDYKNYGGRGISICDEWLDFMNFEAWAMKNGYADELTIDRIDVNGNYEPSNCRWIPISEQQKNRRSSVLVEHNGETHCLKEWAKITGIPYSALLGRKHKRWSVSKMFETPVRGCRHG
jgi:hypothetical protein